MGLMRELVSHAKQSVIAQTPYLIFSRQAKSMLKKLRKKQPNIEFVFSTNSLGNADRLSAYALAFKQRKMQVKKLGAAIYEMKPHPADMQDFIPRYPELLNQDLDPTINAWDNDFEDRIPTKESAPICSIHAKSIVVDGTITIIASHNFDPRSGALNTECGVLIWDEVIATIRQITYPLNSWVIAKRQKLPVISYFSGLLGKISTMMPIFDIWPFQYTSSFDLREDGTPLPPSHPKFYDNYQNVGGRAGAFRPPFPLRTVRDSFPSHGSSPSKAHLCIKKTQ